MDCPCGWWVVTPPFTTLRWLMGHAPNVLTICPTTEFVWVSGEAGIRNLLRTALRLATGPSHLTSCALQGRFWSFRSLTRSAASPTSCELVTPGVIAVTTNAGWRKVEESNPQVSPRPGIRRRLPTIQRDLPYAPFW